MPAAGAPLGSTVPGIAVSNLMTESQMIVRRETGDRAHDLGIVFQSYQLPQSRLSRLDRSRCRLYLPARSSS